MNEQWEQENAAFLNGSLLREKAADPLRVRPLL